MSSSRKKDSWFPMCSQTAWLRLWRSAMRPSSLSRLRPTLYCASMAFLDAAEVSTLSFPDAFTTKKLCHSPAPLRVLGDRIRFRATVRLSHFKPPFVGLRIESNKCPERGTSVSKLLTTTYYYLLLLTTTYYYLLLLTTTYYYLLLLTTTYYYYGGFRLFVVPERAVDFWHPSRLRLGLTSLVCATCLSASRLDASAISNTVAISCWTDSEPK